MRHYILHTSVLGRNQLILFQCISVNESYTISGSSWRSHVKTDKLLLLPPLAWCTLALLHLKTINLFLRLLCCRKPRNDSRGHRNTVVACMRYNDFKTVLPLDLQAKTARNKCFDVQRKGFLPRKGKSPVYANQQSFWFIGELLNPRGYPSIMQLFTKILVMNGCDALLKENIIIPCVLRRLGHLF